MIEEPVHSEWINLKILNNKLGDFIKWFVMIWYLISRLFRWWKKILSYVYTSVNLKHIGKVIRRIEWFQQN